MCETSLVKPSYEELEEKNKELQDVLIFAAQLTIDNFGNPKTPKIPITEKMLIDYWFKKCKETQNERV